MAGLKVDFRLAIKEEEQIYTDLLEIVKHFKIAQIARGLGVSRETLYTWIKGEHLPRDCKHVSIIKSKAAELRRQSSPPSSHLS